MKQVVQNLKTGEVRVLDVPSPRLRPGGALVLTLASVISPGTERSKIELAKKSALGKARARPELARKVIDTARREGIAETYRAVMTRLDAPEALGYSSSGIVQAAAPDCAGIEPGDLVACAGSQYANHAEVNYVPKHLLARAPAGVSTEQAAYGTLGAIALHGVRQAEVELGDRIVIVGLGLIGLLATQLVRAAGGRVLAVDMDPRRCEIAQRLGAELALPRENGVEAAASGFTEGAGADAVVICASTTSDDPVELAARLCRDRARIVVVGAVGMDLPREPFYAKELELRLARSYGPGRYDASYEEHGHDYPIGYVRWTEERNIAEFLRLVGAGAVDVDALTTHRFPVERAAEAYAAISGGAPGETTPLGVVIEYPGAVGRAVTPRVDVDMPRFPGPSRQGQVHVGVVGAGNFATRVLLPLLANNERAVLTGVVSESGLSARHAADRFGFRYAASDATALFEDNDTGAVVIATRHDSHAGLAAQALRAGKAVFCEKPLALTWEELEDVAAAYNEHPFPLLVGFNRRFSPLTQELRDALPAHTPRSIVCRVNAGPLPAEHWSKDPVSGGGRILGELCHFLDLACYLADGTPLRVSAEALGTADELRLNDSVVVQVAFSCGSIASIQYLATGDPRVSKERLEVFSGGTVGLIDDFRRLEVVRDGRRRRHGGRRQDKGHREEMRAFIAMATGAEPTVLTPAAAFWSSALTLQVPVALAHGRPAAVSLPATLTEEP